MPLYEVIVPFRDRGRDPLRAQNVSRVVGMWEDYGYQPWVIGDGRSGVDQFNRSAAYNRGVANAYEGCDGFIFAESDMLIDDRQIDAACELAEKGVGMVVPFTEYRYLTERDSERARDGDDPIHFTPAYRMANGSSIGAINVVSRETMNLVGQWDEKFEGNWYDDDAMKLAFQACAGPTRWVDGPAYHLYHLPGHNGDHLTEQDRAATARNKVRYDLYRAALRTKCPSGLIHSLTMGAR